MDRIVERRKIDEIVRVRDACIEKYNRILGLWDEIKTDCNRIGEHIAPYQRLQSPEEVRKEIDNRLWRFCFSELGVYRYMDAASANKLEREIEDKSPEFTVENIEDTAFSIYDRRQELFAKSIVDVFRGLSDQHKTNTNDKFRIPNKCVVRYIVEVSYGGNLRLRNFSRRDTINDINRVFTMLDNKNFEPRQALCELEAELMSGKNTYECEYYRAKGFKNGNMHIEFKRADLLDKANLIVANYYGSALK